MKKITNKTAFNIILDGFKKEGYNVYVVLISLCNYPSVAKGKIYNLEGKLYASAFAYLCNEYLSEQVSMPMFEDDNQVFFKMNFKENQNSISELIEKHNLKTPTTEEQYIKITFELIQIYKAKIASDLIILFQTETTILRLFAAIFKYDKKPVFDFWRSPSFYKNNFERITFNEIKLQ